MCKVSDRWYSLILGLAITLSVPGAALAQTALTWAKVERLRNRVHLIPNNRSARLARIADVMSVGDSLRTASSSRAELRFNDGSLARVGEQATFRFTPNTRNFQLSNGTVLLLIPPSRGRTTIQTPNAVTGIQGSALFVRVRCSAGLSSDDSCTSPVTVVGALTNNPAGAMIAYNHSGSQQQPIYAGEMVVIEGNTITQRHQFDLKTFYQTSGLVEGLQLDSATPPADMPPELQEVWQEIQDALELQGDFDSQISDEKVVENPGFIAPVVNPVAAVERAAGDDNFVGFPEFASSPAAIFHGVGAAVATSGSGTSPARETMSEIPSNLGTTVDGDTIRDALIAPSSVSESSSVPTPVQPSPSLPTGVGSAAESQPSPPSPSPVVPVPTTPVAVPPSPVVPVPTTPVAVPPSPVEPPLPTAPVSVPVEPLPTAPVVLNPAPPEVPSNPVVSVPTTSTLPEQPIPVVPELPPVGPEQNPGREPLPLEEFNFQQPVTVDIESFQTPESAVPLSGQN